MHQGGVPGVGRKELQPMSPCRVSSKPSILFAGGVFEGSSWGGRVVPFRTSMRPSIPSAVANTRVFPSPGPPSPPARRPAGRRAFTGEPPPGDQDATGRFCAAVSKRWIVPAPLPVAIWPPPREGEDTPPERWHSDATHFCSTSPSEFGFGCKGRRPKRGGQGLAAESPRISLL